MLPAGDALHTPLGVRPWKSKRTTGELLRRLRVIIIVSCRLLPLRTALKRKQAVLTGLYHGMSYDAATKMKASAVPKANTGTAHDR